MDEFDRAFPSWLVFTGPDDVPDPVVERALASARGLDQRGRLALTLAGEAWPHRIGAAPMTTLGRRMLFVALLGMLALSLVAASLLVGAQPERDVTLPTIAPNPILARDRATAVTLEDGRVLIVGGDSDAAIVDAALVDPVNGDVDAIAMVEPRGWGATAVKLPDGRVLVAGGAENVDGASGAAEDTGSAEIFDPATGRFTAVEDMSVPRGFRSMRFGFVPQSVTLTDGRILVVGGTVDGSDSPRPGDIFDAATGTFSQTSPLPCRGDPDGGVYGQEVRSAEVLPDGRVLLICEGWTNLFQGSQPASPIAAFAFDVEDGSAEPVDLGLEGIDRTLRLLDGSILVWSPTGEDRLANGDRLTRHGLARYDPMAGPVIRLEAEIPSGSAVALLGSGHVLFAGGYASGELVASDRVQVLDPCADGLRDIGTLRTTRTGGTASEVGAGVLLAGGQLGHDPNRWEPAGAEIVPLPELPAITCGA